MHIRSGGYVINNSRKMHNDRVIVGVIVCASTDWATYQLIATDFYLTCLMSPENMNR